MKKVLISICLLIYAFTAPCQASTLNHAEPQKHSNFDKNPQLSHEMRKKMRPYLLPMDHPTRPVLDALFASGRPTSNPAAFEAAGFITLHTKPRSFIRVARHPALPGYLFKVYLDSEQRRKNRKPGWEWLTARCQGAAQVRSAIKKIHSRYFQAPRKWLYPLPPCSTMHAHPVILLVEDMDLASDEDTKYAWRHHMTHEHLHELYQIIRKGKGSSYRPDNICLSRNGKFSFIDTEYPNQKGNLSTIGPYLSPDMRNYWRQLVDKKIKPAIVR
jgi:hypothetical protein